jgi:hypothetical protein
MILARVFDPHSDRRRKIGIICEQSVDEHISMQEIKMKPKMGELKNVC